MRGNSCRATAPCNTETACTQPARRTRRMGILGEDIPRRGKQQAGTDSYGQYEVFHLWIPSVETLTHQIHPCRAYSAYGAAGCTLLRMNPNRLPRTADSDRLRLGPRPVTQLLSFSSLASEPTSEILEPCKVP